MSSISAEIGATVPNPIPPEKRSALADELRSIPERVLRVFKIPIELIPLLDALTATVHEMLDDDAGRDWEDRLKTAEAYWRAVAPDDELEARLGKLGEWITSLDIDDLKSSIEQYLSRFTGGSAPRFLSRLLGAKRYLQLKKAAEIDWALALLGIRRLLRLGLPLAQALEDAFVTLNDEERNDFKRSPGQESAYLELLLHLDEMIDAFLERRHMNFSTLGFPARAAEFSVLEVDLAELIRSMQAFLDVDMESFAAELNDMLARKFRGFEQALKNSDDGVGQAATSLIELIDRLLRTAFSKDEVLAWVTEHRRDDPSLVHVKDGKTLPTKKAEALCFENAGQAPPEDARLHEMLANSIVRARTAAQKIKHADRGTLEEAEKLRVLMHAVRGAFTFSFRVNWIKGSARYISLRQKFAQAA